MKKFFNKSAILGVLLVTTQLVNAQVYVVPPSDTVSYSVPTISDEAMKQCVILYNDAKNLKVDINSMYVDNYSQTSVNKYNHKVNRHSQMTNQFNQDCAGKQSESARREAEKLNQENNARLN